MPSVHRRAPRRPPTGRASALARHGRLALVLGACLLALSACESAPVRNVQQGLREGFRGVKQGVETMFHGGNAGAPALAAGLHDYDNAHYTAAAESLQHALDQGLAAPADRIKAHKYLAFIDCTSGQPQQCRAQFRAALEIDPNMKLAPAEAGHPIWGPVFRSVKAQVREGTAGGS